MDYKIGGWKEIKRRGETWEEADMRNKQEDWKVKILEELKEWWFDGDLRTLNKENIINLMKLAIAKTQTLLEKDFDEKIKAIFDELDKILFKPHLITDNKLIGLVEDYETIKKKWSDGKPFEKSLEGK